jgi:hypothetical protein
LHALPLLNAIFKETLSDARQLDRLRADLESPLHWPSVIVAIFGERSFFAGAVWAFRSLLVEVWEEYGKEDAGLGVWGRVSIFH